MKRLFIFIIMLLIALPVFAQNPVTLREMAGAWEAAGMTASDFYGFNLPRIRGTWYFVDAVSGNANWDGLTAGTAVASLSTAYDKCTSGAGDGIVVFARSTSSSSNSILLTTRINWSKYGITTIGVATGGSSSRARIHSEATATDSLATLLYITGQNNAFYNLNFTNRTDCQTTTALRTTQRSAVQIAGARNKFVNCFFHAWECNTAGAATNTYAAYQTTGVHLSASSDETVFESCYFGASSYDPGNTASSWIYLDGAAAQHFWTDCTFLQQVSSGTAFGGYETSGAAVLNGIDIFKRCVFAVWRANTHANICASWFIGTKPNTGNICMLDCLTVGFTKIDAVGANDVVWSNQPAAAAGGGIGVATY